MIKTPFAVVAFIFTVMGAPNVAGAAEIKVLSALAFKPSLTDLTDEFQRTSGHKLTIIYGSAGAVRDRIQSGEIVDVAISSNPMIEGLIVAGKIPGTRH